MSDEAPYGYIDDDASKGPRTKPFRDGAEFGMAARRILLDALHKEPQEPPTPAEIEAAKIANANWEGFIAGESYEREKIVAWLLETEEIYDWSPPTIAAAIIDQEHLG
jgi:hypothetical protein